MRRHWIRSAAEVARKGDLFDPPVNARLFKGLERSRLGVGEAGFDAAFGKNPTPAASLHQQKFDTSAADTITNRGHFLSPFRKLRRS